MTNTEAIEILKNWFNLYSGDATRIRYTPEKFKEAAKMAIEALESQPSTEIVPIGTKVRVLVINTIFDAGDIVEIIGYYIEPPEYKCSNDSEYWFLSREEFEPV